MRIDVKHLDTNTSETFYVKGTSCIVGRSANCDVTISRGELSRQHFRIDVEGEALYITDLKSSNGVNVNGQKLTPEKKTPFFLFQSLDIIERVAFTISEFEGPKTEPSAPEGKEERPREQRQLSRTIRIATPSAVKAKTQRMYLLLGGLVVATAIFIFAVQNKKETLAKKAAPTVVANLPKTDPGDYKELIKKSQCQSKDKLCDELNLTHPWEGILNKQGKLMVFVNLNQSSEEAVHAVIKKLPEIEIQKLVLAKVATQPDLLDYASEISAREIIVVGFTSLDEIISPRVEMQVDKAKVPELSDKTHGDLFGEIFFHGRPKLYDKYLSKSLHFQRL
ncbi:MAG: FHA domain-containing protein [Bacteriovoracaceae bacterium]